MPQLSNVVRPQATVNYFKQPDGSIEFEVSFMPDPEQLVGEGESRAVLALDASRSIKPMFGNSGPFGGDPNYVELVSRKLAEILARITKSGKCLALYWALNPGGSDIEEIGEIDAANAKSYSFSGPTRPKYTWGTGTKLAPVIRHIVEKVHKGSDWTMGVIITDGIIEDEPECMKYCMDLGKKMAAESKQNLKLIMVGVGAEVDEAQLIRFDDMFEGTDLEEDVDIWNTGIAAHMKDEDDIMEALFGELMSEDQVVADTGSILDGHGNEIRTFADGLPGKFRFTLPKAHTQYTIHTPRGDVVQDVSGAL